MTYNRRYTIKQNKKKYRTKQNKQTLLYNDLHILKEAKKRQKNVTIAWIESKKANYIVQQTWIIDCLKMYKISDKIINFIMNAVENWRAELTSERHTLEEERIKSGIFQGESLPPIL